jgi:hypothetical protein
VSSRLSRKLRREIKASPRKAAVLAALSFVGLWFWVPLVAKWLGKTDAEAASTSPVAAAMPQPRNSAASVITATTPNVTPGAPALTAAGSRRPWQQLLASIERDARMKPATDLGSGRDPFHPLEEKKVKKGAAVLEKPDLTPADAGLSLSSTIVGAGDRTALIGRDVYREGDTIATTHGEGEFRLVEIRPREVVLERSGKLYRLDLPTNQWVVKSK